MFYSETFSNNLRFGDVLKGFLHINIEINNPIIDKYVNFKINIEMPEYCVIMDPCCNIEEGAITLTPLKKIDTNWLSNIYLEENITTLNNLVKPIEVMHPDQWNALSPEKKEEYMNEPKRYQRIRYFIYEQHELLLEYEYDKKYKFTERKDEREIPLYIKEVVNQKNKTKYYMIDFKNLYYIKCDKITSPKNVLDEKMKKAKILELSINSRNELRDKLAFWFQNKPDEDKGAPQSV